MESLAGGTGWLKAGLLGFPKSGKTYTAMLLARAVQERLGLTGRIAMFDTEAGSSYIAPSVRKLTGHDLVGDRARSFQSMMDFALDCEKDETIDVAIFDSVTHPWRELCDSYLERVNRGRKSKRRPALPRLAFHHWGIIKGIWAEFTNWYLNSDTHCIICGRAGYNYDYVENDETEKQELRKTGVKMKTETEFGFEPSLLIEMQRATTEGDTAQLARKAVVIGDRFATIDGEEFVMPSTNDVHAALAVVKTAFGPHLKLLVPGAHAPVDVATVTEPDVDDDGFDRQKQYAIKRDIILEEIKGELTAGWGASGKKRQAILKQIFASYSPTFIEKLKVEELVDGLDKIRVLRIEMKAAEEEAAEAEKVAVAETKAEQKTAKKKGGE